MTFDSKFQFTFATISGFILSILFFAMYFFEMKRDKQLSMEYFNFDKANLDEQKKKFNPLNEQFLYMTIIVALAWLRWSKYSQIALMFISLAVITGKSFTQKTHYSRFYSEKMRTVIRK